MQNIQLELQDANVLMGFLGFVLVWFFWYRYQQRCNCEKFKF